MWPEWCYKLLTALEFIIKSLVHTFTIFVQATHENLGFFAAAAAHRSRKAIFHCFLKEQWASGQQHSPSPLPAASGTHEPRRWDSLCFHGPDFQSAISSPSSQWQCDGLSLGAVFPRPCKETEVHRNTQFDILSSQTNWIINCEIPHVVFSERKTSS